MILKLVPRDLLFQLPVPKRLREYLNTPFYYSEAIADWTEDKSVATTSTPLMAAAASEVTAPESVTTSTLSTSTSQAAAESSSATLAPSRSAEVAAEVQAASQIENGDVSGVLPPQDENVQLL